MISLPLDLFGEGTVFHHVGLAVTEADRPPGSSPENDPRQRVDVSFAELHGLKVEFVSPAAEDSPVNGAIRRGQQLLHLCFETPDLERSIAAGERNGFRCIAAPVPAAAFGQRRIAWLFSRGYGLVELLESGSGSA